MIYGAFIGDMVGVPYEFINCKIKDFEFWSEFTRYSDDTIMTAAIADALLEIGKDKLIEEALPILTQKMQQYGRKYPGAGYGVSFASWIDRQDPQPYNSWGNGSAMRVSAVGWLYDSLELTEEKAKWTALPTHNHPEGVKGAQAVAAAIYMARTGSTQKEIKKYISKRFDYDLDRTCDKIRKTYQFEVSCQKSVPEAIIAFLEADSFEDAIRNAVSLNGDADTQAAIAGSIAEAYFGIPDDMIAECKKRLPEDIIEIAEKFNSAAKEPIKVPKKKGLKIKLFRQLFK